jgi:phosphatidylinositol alpha-1,6-mannosyltransferase
MRIAFYTPFKPLLHPHPSGDLVIARGLHRFLSTKGHEIWPVGPLRTRWIYWKPWRLPAILKAHARSRRLLYHRGIDLWLTYHTYYKAPDMLGPRSAETARIPYVIFQGIYSTKRRKRLKTWPGFQLNKKALLTADHVFSNRREDWTNLKRIIPADRLTYVRPGIDPAAFARDERGGMALRTSWKVGSDPVVLSAAMFRPDVKTEGLAWVIRSCGRLVKQGTKLHLVIAGDGRERGKLERLAAETLPGRTRFVGKTPRSAMARFYSAGDLFAFPGIRESLGMVFLESQACGLPVVAFLNGGIPEVVRDGETGFLSPLYDEHAFDLALLRLLSDRRLRGQMGGAATAYIRGYHDMEKNYTLLDNRLNAIVERRHHAAG